MRSGFALIVALAGHAACSSDTAELASNAGQSQDPGAGGVAGGPSEPSEPSEESAGAPGTGCRCEEPEHCGSLDCQDGFCLPSQCENGVRDGGEVDVDCGGRDCTPCVPGHSCISNGDCLSGICDCGLCLEAGDSAACDAACDDGVLNLDETGIDCGGVCPPCEAGQRCLVDPDCRSGSCRTVLARPTCGDVRECR
jgi:hypothetical protein